MCTAFQPLILHLIHSFVIKVSLCQNQDTGGPADNTRQRGGTQENRQKLKQNAVFHLLASLHFITLSPDHFQVSGFRGIDLDLFPQMADVDRYSTFTAQSGFLPYGLIQQFGGVDFSGICINKCKIAYSVGVRATFSPSTVTDLVRSSREMLPMVRFRSAGAGQLPSWA